MMSLRDVVANNVRLHNKDSQLILDTCDLHDAIVDTDSDSLKFFN